MEIDSSVVTIEGCVCDTCKNVKHDGYIRSSLIVSYFRGDNTHFTVALPCEGGPRWHSGEGAVLQIGRLQVRFQMVSLEFFIDIIPPIAPWPWGRLSLQQK